MIGSGETTVDLFVDNLTLSRLGSNFMTDPAEEEVIVDFGVINDTSTVPGRETAVHSGLYDPHCNITAPVISGIENNKTYCDTVEFTVTDNDGIASVKAGNTELTESNGKYTLEKGAGTVTIVATDKAKNETTITVTVNNGHTAGNDDGNCSTPVYCIYHPDTVVVAANSHDFSGEWNKDENGHWHTCQNDGCTVAEPKASHFGTDDGDCTTAVICECGYTITAANAEHTYEWQSNGDGTHTRYCTVDGCNDYEDGDCDGGEANYFNKAVCDECNEEYGNLLTDTTAPTGEISIGTNKWNSFLNTITFGMFFKDTQSVTVTAADDSYDHDGYTDDKAVKVEYYLYSGDTALIQAELAGKEFTIYNGDFNINPDNKYVVYAKLTDHAGNITYISSEGIVLDATSPFITGVENGKTYCEAQTVTVTEEYIESVKVNGTEVPLDENNQFTLNPAEGTQTIVVTDKAGNVSVEITVTVNDGHTDENKDHACDYGCSETIGVHEDTDKDHACDYGCSETIGVHEDTDKDHACDYGCSETIGIHEDTDKDHACDYGCSETIGEHKDEDKDHACDYGCSETIGEHNDEDKDHNCDYGCSETIGVHEDSNKDHACDYGCSVAIGEHKDEDKDHACDYCGIKLSEHTGGKATCEDKAKCEICGAAYGELDPNNHADLKYIEAKEATNDAEGNIEYWYCDGCDKYYSNAAATKEITKSDTVTAKLPDDSKSPQTGDTSNLALWIALLFISSGTVIGTTVIGKKKKRIR